MSAASIETQATRAPADHTRMIERPSVILYSHDGFGIGHLSRTIYLAHRIREGRPDANVLLVTSSAAAHRLSALDDLEYIKLPSVTKAGVERYHPRNLRASLASIIELRSSLILSIVQQVRPDLFLVDHRPLGLKRELLPALDWIKRDAPEVRTVVGLRDIVDGPGIVQSDWQAQGIYDALVHLYDHVLVYGDREIFDLGSEYAMPDSVLEKLVYTGYLGREVAQRPRDEVRRSLGVDGDRLVVVHAGGGDDGFTLLHTYLRGVDSLPPDVRSLVVTGPLMERVERQTLRKLATEPGVTLVDYQDDLAGIVGAADLSVSMGGYNTICELLSARVPAIVMPRTFPRREQQMRTELLAARGLVELFPSDNHEPVQLAERVRAALESPVRASRPIALNGGEVVRDFLCSLLDEHSMAGMNDTDAYQVVNQ